MVFDTVDQATCAATVVCLSSRLTAIKLIPIILCFAKFDQVEFSITYSKEIWNYVVFRRSITDWTKGTLQNSVLLNLMQFYPKCEYVKCTDGTWSRHVSESWTADNVWKIWVSLQSCWSLKKVINIICIGWSPSRLRWDQVSTFRSSHMVWQVKTIFVWDGKRVSSDCMSIGTPTQCLKHPRMWGCLFVSRPGAQPPRTDVSHGLYSLEIHGNLLP